MRLFHILSDALGFQVVELNQEFEIDLLSLAELVLLIIQNGLWESQKLIQLLVLLALVFQNLFNQELILHFLNQLFTFLTFGTEISFTIRLDFTQVISSLFFYTILSIFNRIQLLSRKCLFINFLLRLLRVLRRLVAWSLGLVIRVSGLNNTFLMAYFIVNWAFLFECVLIIFVLNLKNLLLYPGIVHRYLRHFLIQMRVY